MDVHTIIKSLFEGESWHGFHDTVYEATGKSYSKEILMELFYRLPAHLHTTAFEWGLSDTDFLLKVDTYIRSSERWQK